MSDVIDAGLCYSTFYVCELVFGLYDYDIHIKSLLSNICPYIVVFALVFP